jgi:hypothetical protein
MTPAATRKFATKNAEILGYIKNVWAAYGIQARARRRRATV